MRQEKEIVGLKRSVKQCGNERKTEQTEAVTIQGSVFQIEKLTTLSFSGNGIFPMGCYKLSNDHHAQMGMNFFNPTGG